MTEQQKEIVRYLLRKSYDNGFSNSYRLHPIAEKLGITPKEIYDPNTETGLMAEYSQSGNGFLEFSPGHGAVNIDCRDLLENWSDYR